MNRQAAKAAKKQPLPYLNWAAFAQGERLLIGLILGQSSVEELDEVGIVATLEVSTCTRASYQPTTATAANGFFVIPPGPRSALSA